MGDPERIADGEVDFATVQDLRRRLAESEAETARIREAAIRHGVALERLVAERTADLEHAKVRVASEVEYREIEQRARREVDALYAAYIDNTTDGVFVVAVADGADITVETVNRVMERALNTPRSELRGKQIGDVLTDALAERLVEQIRVCVASRSPLRYEDKAELNGDDRNFEINLSPVPAADGRTVRVVGSARDITERREAEQQLRQAQKMEAIGQLTGGVAHDFNNLLQVVKGNLDLLAHDLGAAMTPAIEKRLKDAMSGAERGSKLTRQLLAFSRRQPLTPKPTDVGALVSAMADLLQRTLGENVEVTISCDDGAWTALVDPAQLENAVLNLAINARDAMPDGGQLAIAVRNMAGAGDQGDSVEIAVADRGFGMSQAVLARVFEPFFSTKPEGRGTGLGLPQVQGFIEQSHGRIEIESAPGEGTTVRLSLPRSDKAAEVEPETQQPAGALGRGERILMLEDDDAVRNAVAGLLVALGYKVASVGTTREAAALLDAGEQYDLLLSDVVMPGTPSPPDFAKTACEKRPGLKVLFMSGYAEDRIVHQGRIDAHVHLIEKPYRKEELSRKLRQLLDVDRPSTRPEKLRVLLVEDEPLIAMGVSDLLTSFGYTVIEARNATVAQAAISGGAEIDLVLTDIGLPDMDGEKLAAWCREQRPGMPIVFSTGRDDFHAPAGLAADGPVGVLIKPFDVNTLKNTIEACV